MMWYKNLVALEGRYLNQDIDLRADSMGLNYATERPPPKTNWPKIDIHVHCRDGTQAYKAKIADVMALARMQGIVALCDMPNTEPPLTTRKRVEERFALARSEGIVDGYYVHMGVTADRRQIAEAVATYRRNTRVVGFKLYAGTSVGSLAVTRKRQQQSIYQALVEYEYDGVLAVHCEKESMFRMELWDPSRPWTWNDARPPSAEVVSVKDQIRFANAAGFKGTLHIPHISTPEAVDIVVEEQNNQITRDNGFGVTCGVTPHHLLRSTEDMHDEDGIMLKGNPPLRDADMVIGLRERLLRGNIDWIETDHAPHTLEDKRERHMSGIPSLETYARSLETLLGLGFVGSTSMLRNLTYDNIKRVYTRIRE